MILAILAAEIPTLPPEATGLLLPVLYVIIFIIAILTIIGVGLWHGFHWLKRAVNGDVIHALNQHETLEKEWKDDLRKEMVETNRRIDTLVRDVIGFAQETLGPLALAARNGRPPYDEKVPP